MKLILILLVRIIILTVPVSDFPEVLATFYTVAYNVHSMVDGAASCCRVNAALKNQAYYHMTNTTYHVTNTTYRVTDTTYHVTRKG